jgi:predicted Zn finger-like uncharacterized protein
MIVSCPSCQRNYVVADDQIAGKQFRARCKSCGVEFRLDGMSSREPSADAKAGEPAPLMSATEAFLALQSTPPPAAAPWSVCLSQTDTRRMTTDEVVQAVAKGTINEGVFVWRSTMTNWARLSDVPELMAAISRPGSRVPHPVVVGQSSSTAKPDSEGRVVVGRPSTKSAAPQRFGSTLTGSQPPVATSSSVPPRSGKTFPPPPLVPEMFHSTQAPQRVATASSEGDDAVGAADASNEPGRGTVRSSTPSPPQKLELEIPIDVDAAPPADVAVPQAAGAAALPAAGVGSVPPAGAAAPPTAGVGSVPPAGTENVGVPSGLIIPSAPDTVQAQPTQPPMGAVAESKPKVGESTVATARTKSVGESYPPVAETKPKRFGTVAGMLAVGAVGVLGGVAGAVYVMKSPSEVAPQAAATVGVALRPQPATPVASASPVAADTNPATLANSASAGNDAPPRESGGAVADGDATAASAQGRGDKSKSQGRAAQTVAAVSRPTTTSGAATPGAKADPKPSDAKVPAPPIPAQPPVLDVKVDSDKSSKAKESAPSTAPGSGGAPFNREAAMAVLGLAASRAPSCKKPDGPAGTAKVYVTFDPNGVVVIANVTGAPIAGTPVAQCVANIFRRVKVAPFSGERASVVKDVTIPP